MKYCILLILLLSAFSAFSQSIMPSVDYLSLEITGIQFSTSTTTTHYEPYGVIRTEHSSGTDSISSSFAKSNSPGKVVGEAVRFYGSYSYGDPSFSLYAWTKTVEVELDTVNHLIKRLHYQYEYKRNDKSNAIDWDSKSFSFELYDIPFIQYGDTIVYSVDRDFLSKNTNGFGFSAASGARYSNTITMGYFRGLSPNAFLKGKFVKLNTHSSFITPNYYGISIDPDILLRKYHSDSIAVNYRNDYPDTVTILRLESIGGSLTDQTITYANGKPLTTKQIVLPNTKDHKLYLSYTSIQGPFVAVNDLTFSVTKEIRGVIYHDAVVLSVSLKDVDYEPYISIDTTIPNHQLVFESEIGDTVLKSIRIDYTNEIYGLSFPPILDAKEFTLEGVEHANNTKEVEFLFASDTAGSFTYNYYFDYLVKDFKGNTHYRHYSTPILLTANVTAKQSVQVDADLINIQIFPNPTSGIVSVIMPSELSTDPVLSLYDILGNEVISQRIKSTGKIGQISLPNTVQSGSYYMILKAGSNRYTCLLKVNR